MKKARVIGEAVSSISENSWTEYGAKKTIQEEYTWPLRAPRRKVTRRTKKYCRAKLKLYVPPKFLRDFLRWRAWELALELEGSLLNRTKIPSKFCNLPLKNLKRFFKRSQRMTLRENPSTVPFQGHPGNGKNGIKDSTRRFGKIYWTHWLYNPTWRVHRNPPTTNCISDIEVAWR